MGEFVTRKLVVVAHAGGFTQWAYNGHDLPFEKMLEAHFFDSAADMLATHDLMVVAGKDGMGFRRVISVDGVVYLEPLK